MLTLYLLLTVMLISALCIFANKKNFLPALFILIASPAIYYFSGNHDDLKTWLTQGKQHYDLLIQYNQLGGIDGIIAGVKKKLAANPNDAQGWLILGKLYHAKQDNAAAKEAFAKAKSLPLKKGG